MSQIAYLIDKLLDITFLVIMVIYICKFLSYLFYVAVKGGRVCLTDEDFEEFTGMSSSRYSAQTRRILANALKRPVTGRWTIFPSRACVVRDRENNVVFWIRKVKTDE